MNQLKEFILGLKKGTSSFGENISTIVNSVLLTIVYLLGIGPTSIIARISRKKFLETDFNHDSYWSDLNLSTRKKEEYYRQF